MNHFCLFLIVVFGCRFSLFGQVITPEAKERAASLVSQMTLDEKLEYIGGYEVFISGLFPDWVFPRFGWLTARSAYETTRTVHSIRAVSPWLLRGIGILHVPTAAH